jgi:hypothetical protein
MKLTFLVILTFSFCISISAQADILLLQKNDQTIKTWVSGSYINFQFSNYQWITGVIKMIRNDSISVRQMEIRTVPDRFGFPTIDTAWFGTIKLHVNEIRAMPKKAKWGQFITNGSLLQLGSLAYIFLNLVNGFILNQSNTTGTNLTSLGIAGGVFIAGTILKATHKENILLGKKYTIKTISN